MAAGAGSFSAAAALDFGLHSPLSAPVVTRQSSDTLFDVNNRRPNSSHSRQAPAGRGKPQVLDVAAQRKAAAQAAASAGGEKPFEFVSSELKRQQSPVPK